MNRNEDPELGRRAERTTWAGAKQWVSEKVPLRTELGLRAEGTRWAGAQQLVSEPPVRRETWQGL